ncbi:MAG: hypothetical protein WC089_02255 [Candidatus Paceibacterota bacterium]
MKKILHTIKILIIALVFTVAINWVSAAYTPKPSVSDPASNLGPVINTGNKVQNIWGSLSLGTTASSGSTLNVYGNSYIKSLGIWGNFAQVGSVYSNELYIWDIQDPYGLSVSTGGGSSGSSSSVYTLESLCIDTNKEIIICP